MRIGGGYGAAWATSHGVASLPGQCLCKEPSAMSVPNQCLEEEPLVATATVPSSAVVMPILRANLMNTSSSVALDTPQSSTCAFERSPPQLAAGGGRRGGATAAVLQDLSTGGSGH
jgi:hypothetical protein